MGSHWRSAAGRFARGSASVRGSVVTHGGGGRAEGFGERTRRRGFVGRRRRARRSVEGDLPGEECDSVVPRRNLPAPRHGSAPAAVAPPQPLHRQGKACVCKALMESICLMLKGRNCTHKVVHMCFIPVEALLQTERQATEAAKREHADSERRNEEHADSERRNEELIKKFEGALKTPENGNALNGEVKSSPDVTPISLNPKELEAEEKPQKSLNEKQQENQDLLIKCVSEDLGFSSGKPIAACLIYRCLLHWRSFEVERTGVFDRIIQTIGSAIEMVIIMPSALHCFLEDALQTSKRFVIEVHNALI